MTEECEHLKESRRLKSQGEALVERINQFLDKLEAELDEEQRFERETRRRQRDGE